MWPPAGRVGHLPSHQHFATLIHRASHMTGSMIIRVSTARPADYASTADKTTVTAACKGLGDYDPAVIYYLFRLPCLPKRDAEHPGKLMYRSKGGADD